MASLTTDQVVFDRVTVDNIVSGGARISWEMNRHFIDPGTYSFQLQTGHTESQLATDWVNVGAPVVDTYYAIDTTQRTWGKTLDNHYRVVLTTTRGTYTSRPESCDGHLNRRNWLEAREIVRKEQLRHRVLTSPSGYLLKARRYGPKCQLCADTYTDEVSNTHCLRCYGTGFDFGYFTPLPAVFADVSLPTSRDHRLIDRGMENQSVIQARFIGDPQLYSYDVWINATSDERYYIHTVKTAAQHRGVAIIYDAELRLAPFSDVIYKLNLSTFTRLATAGNLQGTLQCPPQKKQELNYLEQAINDARKAKRSAKSSAS